MLAKSSVPCDLTIRTALYLLQVRIKLVRHCDSTLEMLVHHTLLLELGQLPCRGDGISDLPAVHLKRCQLLDITLDVVKVNARRL